MGMEWDLREMGRPGRGAQWLSEEGEETFEFSWTTPEGDELLIIGEKPQLEHFFEIVHAHLMGWLEESEYEEYD